jgi:hypothetical protein
MPARPRRGRVGGAVIGRSGLPPGAPGDLHRAEQGGTFLPRKPGKLAKWLDNHRPEPSGAWHGLSTRWDARGPRSPASSGGIAGRERLPDPCGCEEPLGDCGCGGQGEHGVLQVQTVDRRTGSGWVADP